ncbi:transglycosylase domain-containing protein [Microbacterium sp. EYE_5]|uniref:transglycosylase domain-containing protein n=1 Tax=unclassified Microbacterium TaxID=2609290 RepID=UPI0020066578|nr:MULTISPECIES: transglycosylase domain-containing protein [unclassified Microbacterium]MCK6080337.1 transglycosylase domain-containing protein [Microbacterium sp. EYE_382]MCK6085608.1 transglycosylase domain-containing protein [Microbacterium sp. EYE_384]MCK6122167.1 transglycosylase domain-containing protein [Microbacterium sp. EYE_80]MCK6126371.1 transglycosylase domain-containing protein [Microbacterium sp. EYE_79]MCK6141292.1 transglycosylase domain-containing protein [Microbacterium sp.
MPHSKRTATGVLGGVLGLIGLSTVAGLLVTATVTPAIAVSGYAASSAIEMFDNMPSYLKIDKLMLPSTIYVKNTEGKNVKLTEFYDQNRIPVTFDEVNPVVYDAFLSSEDKNFYSHGGIDLLGTVSALARNASSGSNRGGSSITQQYVKNVLQQNCEAQAENSEQVTACYDESTANEGTEGYTRKLQEMRYAIQLEKEYSKNEILVGYLNIAHFGGSTYGIGAAARHYFDTTPAKLTIGQAAVIAGMVQSPNTLRIDKKGGTRTTADGTAVNGAEDGYSLSKNRQVYVLDRMLQDGKITKEEHDAAVDAPLEPKITSRPQGCSEATGAGGAQFFCSYVTSIIRNDPAFGEDENDGISALRRGGLKIYTTLDAALQKAANEAISVVPDSVDYMDLGSAGVQVEVGTGRILSMVQNRPWADDADGKTTTQVNYNVRGKNGGASGFSAGSTYKVFSLINWLQQGHSVNEIVNGRVGEKRVETCDGQYTDQPADNSQIPGHIGNFEGNSGYNGSVYRFTKDSLNSGFLAMAEKISICSTNRLAMDLGVMRGDGKPLDDQNVPYDVLGSGNVAPLDMAQVYAAIAGNGVLCEPKAIDRVVDQDGNDMPIPETTCERKMTEAVASTAAYALRGVMQGDGTGSGARTFDGVPIMGKTGIHQFEHTWMDGASTKVATVVWVGNANATKVGDRVKNIKLDEHWESGYRLSRIRNAIWPDMQRAANARYGGDAFPEPDRELTKQTYVTLPSVIGLDTDAATDRLRNAGFSVSVGDAVDATEAEGTIVEQSPGAGRVVAGTNVTIRPSNGQGSTVPGVGGTPQQAADALRAAGFTNLAQSCEQTEGAPPEGVVTGTDPAAGETVSRSQTITIEFQAPDCGGGQGGGENDDAPGNGNGNGNGRGNGDG